MSVASPRQPEVGAEGGSPRGAARTDPLLSAHLLGTIAVETSDRRLGARDFGGVKPKQVFEILLAERGRAVPKDRLADHLWSEGLPRNVSATLETYVSVLRKRLFPERALNRQVIVTEPEAYRFATERAWIDLDEFDRLTSRVGRGQAARVDLERALDLVRGDLFEDEPYAQWAFELREDYRERVVQTIVAAATIALAERDFAVGLRHADRAIRLDRFLEPGYVLAMAAHYALGRRQDALKIAQRGRAAFMDELGIALPGEVGETERAILDGVSPSILLPAETGTVIRLAAERQEPRPLLGRHRELAELTRAREAADDGSFQLVLIAGEAGMGKTRLLDEFVSAQVGRRLGRAACSAVSAHFPASRSGSRCGKRWATFSSPRRTGSPVFPACFPSSARAAGRTRSTCTRSRASRPWSREPHPSRSRSTTSISPTRRPSPRSTTSRVAARACPFS